MARIRLEKIVVAIVVLIVILGFLRCAEGIWIDARNGNPGDGGVPPDWCGDGACVDPEDASNCALDCDYDVVVVVEDAIAPLLASSLETYVADLASEGRRARVESWQPGTVESLKELLFRQVDRYGVEGALLVGNLPAAFYEQAVICDLWNGLGECVLYYYEDFPTDVYLQDRNALWEDNDGNGIFDAHGDLELEIFVSRLQVLPNPDKCTKSQFFPLCPEEYEPSSDFYASAECVSKCPSRVVPQVWKDGLDAECCGPHFLIRYFDRLHRYRTEGALLPREAFVFVDDDFTGMVFRAGLESIYSEVELAVETEQTTREAYLERLSGPGVEFVHQFIHSDVSALNVQTCAEWSVDADPPECLEWRYERIYRTQIGDGPGGLRHDLRSSFLTMYNCFGARFTQPNFAMAMTLQTDHGLATIGSTRKGGITDATVFHGALANGASWGEAYRRWYNEVGKHRDRWYLGVVLTGDPMLMVPIEATGDLVSGLEVQPMDPPETPKELLERDPPRSFEDYKRDNPQFFED